VATPESVWNQLVLSAQQVGNVLVTFQKHHVINVATFNGSSFLQALQSAGLWDQHSFALNGLALADTAAGASAVGSARHSGGHTAYNNFIKSIVAEFDARYSTGNFGGLSSSEWLAESAKKINGLASFLKIELADPNSALKLHSSDPRIDLDSKSLWGGLKEILFDGATMDFKGAVTGSDAYRAGFQSGAAVFDATPGSGSALDIDRRLAHGDLAGALKNEFGLDSRPNIGQLLTTSLGSKIFMTGAKILTVVGVGLGVIGIATDFAEAATASQQAAAEGDELGADAEWAAFMAKQVFTTGRLVAAYAAGDGSLEDTLQQNEQLANRWADAAKRAYLAHRLKKLEESGEPIPEKYQNFFANGDGAVNENGVASATTANNETVQFSIGENGLEVAVINEQGQPVVTSTTDSDGNINLQTREASGASTEVAVSDNSIAFEQRSSTGETIAEGHIIDTGDGRPAVVVNREDEIAVEVGDEEYDPEQPTVVDLVAGLASTLGSTLGNILANEAGGGAFAKVAIGTLAGAVGAHLGNLIKADLFTDASSYGETALNAGYQEINATFSGTLLGAGISQISSLLIAELADELGIDGFEGAIFQTIGTSITTKLITNIYNVATAAPNASLFAGFDGSFALGVFNSVGSILGSTLAAQIVYPTNQAGSIGASIGSAVGGLVGSWLIPIPFLGSAVGSFLGQIAGTLLGGIFGSDPEAWASVSFNAATGLFVSGGGAGHGGNPTAFLSMASHQAQTVNALVAFTGARVDPFTAPPLNSVPIWYSQIGNDFVYSAPGINYSNYQFNSYDPLLPKIDPGLLGLAKAVDLLGGDILMRRVWENSQATNTSAFSADLQIAKDYRLYLENMELINAIMAASPESAFTTGWALTLLRAEELKLNVGSVDDFKGGFVEQLGGSIVSRLEWVPSFDVNEPDTLVLDNPNGADFRIDNAFGPGLTKTVAGTADGESIDLSSQPVHSVIHVAAGGGNDAVTGSSGTDLLDGGAGSDSINGAGGHDWIHGGDGNDTLNGGATGDDLLAGGNGDDTLVGGTGRDTLIGGAGSDLILVDANDKGDVIYAATTTANSDIDIVRFGENVNISDTQFTRSGADLNVYFNGYGGASSGHLFVKDFFLTQSGIDRFEFIDGVKLASQIRYEGGWGYTEFQQPLDGGGHRRIQLDGSIEQYNWTSIVTDYDASGTMVGQTRYYDNGIAASAIVGGSADDVLNGGAADEVLLGEGGNDTLNGNAGSDILEGAAGNDTLDGGAGSDILEGGAGNDSYVIADSDVVTEAANAGTDTVLASITHTLVANVENLTLTGTAGINGTGNSLDNVITGNAGNNALSGSSGHDTLDGGAGNDSMRGGTGNDTYVFGLGSGQDTIDNSDGGTDRVVFGAGVTAAMLTFTKLGNDLQILISGVSDTLTVANWFLGASYQIASFQLANGSTVTPQIVVAGGTAGHDTLIGSDQADQINGLAGNDTLYGMLGNDVLTGGTGGDALYGGEGHDTYLFSRGDGGDAIYDDYRRYWDGYNWVEPGQGTEIREHGGLDVLSFGSGITASDLTIKVLSDRLIVAVKDPANPGATFDQLGDKITLLGWNDPLNRIETFVLGDGSALSLAGIAGRFGTDGADTVTWTETAIAADFGAGNDTVTSGAFNDALTGGSGNDTLNAADGADTLNGGADNDTLNGGAGNDTLDGGSGNDALRGGTGNDIYLFGIGSGQDTIDNSDGGTDRVQFGAGIAASAVTFAQSGIDLRISITGTSDTLVIKKWFLGAPNQVTLMLADSTTVAPNIPVIAGTAGNDTLNGTSANELMFGAAGFDTLNGNLGNDDLFGGTSLDALRGGGGNDAYWFYRGDGADSVYDDYRTTENVWVVSGYDDGYGNWVDNSYWTTVQVRHDGGADALAFGPEISAADVAVQLAGSHLYVFVRDPANPTHTYWVLQDRITLENWTDSLNRVESLRLNGVDRQIALGTSVANTLSGTAGNDWIFGLEGNDSIAGNAGNDVLDGGTGNDTLTGGAGYDTYVFGRGGGQDIIVNGVSGNPGASGDLVFTTDVAKNQLWFKQVGNDLVVSVMGTTDKVTVSGWYSSSYAPLQDIKVAGGWELDSGLAQLVQAMATYSTNNPSFNPASVSQAPADSTLQGALAAAWHQ
jgi:Ca2+-binding RTX toxin-like protein